MKSVNREEGGKGGVQRSPFLLATAPVANEERTASRQSCVPQVEKSRRRTNGMMQMSVMGRYESQSQLSVQGLWKRGQDAPHRQAEASPKQVRDRSQRPLT